MPTSVSTQTFRSGGPIDNNGLVVTRDPPDTVPQQQTQVTVPGTPQGLFRRVEASNRHMASNVAVRCRDSVLALAVSACFPGRTLIGHFGHQLATLVIGVFPHK